MAALRSDPNHADGLQRLRRTASIRLKRQASSLAFDASHAERVVRNALQGAAAFVETEREDVDADALTAACVLHEIGRGAERAKESRVDATLRIAEEMLRADGLADLVWAVCETLAQVLTPGRQPETPEARLLHDADLLEDLGAIGIARTMADALSSATPLLYDRDDPRAKSRDLDSATYVIDAFPQRRIPAARNAQTAWGRDEAAKRGRVLAGYYEAFLREAGAE